MESNRQDNVNTVFNEKGERFIVNLNGNIQTSSIDNPDLLDEGYGMDYQPVSSIGLCSDKKIRRELVFKNRYFHQITEDQATSIEDIVIALPEKIFDISLIKVQSKYGLMEYGGHYVIEPTSDEIRIKVKNVKLKKGDFIEIFLYEVPFNAENPIHIFGGSSLISTTRNLYTRAALNVEWSLTSAAKCKTTVNGEF
jgi:hypothetical protein